MGSLAAAECSGRKAHHLAFVRPGSWTHSVTAGHLDRVLDSGKGSARLWTAAAPRTVVGED